MCLHSRYPSEIPPEIAEWGREFLAEDNPYRLIGDRLSDLISDEDFVDLYSPIGGGALSPTILALVTVFQMMEKLPDRAAALAVMVRLDWKYALHLPLAWKGFHFTNLSLFSTDIRAEMASINMKPVTRSVVLYYRLRSACQGPLPAAVSKTG